ncbi:hypothetical protein C8J57DRAFT_1295617 [Mycena rebaudengoi]|nr:hypothetical protein C8J57DRAFT_1295617 [Mycena rebaudengoi]
MVSFPQELVETIIDAVHTSHGKKSLRACALASKALLVASQRCLFRSISLGKSPTQVSRNKIPKARNENLGRNDLLIAEVVNLFTSSPHLATYVRSLSISMMEINGVLILAHLTCLFAILPNVERLQFDAANRSWTSLPPTLTSSLSDFVRRPSLQSLALVGLKDLSSPLLLRWLLSVREVSFTNVAILRDTEAPLLILDEETAPTVHRLTLGWPNGPSLARFLLRPATITHLQQLCYVSLQVHLDGSLLGLHPLLLQCSQSLRHLELNFRGNHKAAVELPHLPALRALTLNCQVMRPYIPDSFILTIEHAPLWMPALEVLTLEIHPIAHHSQDVATRAWVVADEALARGLPRLHAVTIVSSVHNTEVPDAFPTFVSDVKSALPQARDAGLLTFIDELGRSDAH